MSKPKIHLDMDTSRRDVYQALLSKGHDVTRTPNPEVRMNASDEYQLLWATSHRRILFSFNIKDYIRLATLHPYHSGILLANQKSTRPAQLILVIDCILTETTGEDWIGQVRFSSSFLDRKAV